MRKNQGKRSNSHLRAIFVVLLLCCGLVISNVFYVMISKKHLWSQENVLNRAIGTSLVTTTSEGKRGTIYDSNHIALAQETTAYTLVGYLETRDEEEIKQISRYNPADYVQDIDLFIESIKEVLGDTIDEENIRRTYRNAVQQGYSQFELGNGTKRLDAETKLALEQRRIPGLGFIETTKRYYPNTPFSSNLIGFASYNEDTEKAYGSMGLELALESYLSGSSGIIQYQRTRTNDVIPGTNTTLESSIDGYDINLTIDSNLQQVVEEQMEITMRDNKAEKAWTIVMEVATGKILAWASYPTFDQNKHLEIPSFIDNISDMSFEPGSVIKPLTFAVALDTGVFPYNTTYRAGEFRFDVDDEGNIVRLTNEEDETDYPAINDANETDYGTLTFEEGLAHSSNIAICELLSKYISRENFVNYMHRFGLFKETGINYVHEVTGTENNSTAIDYLSSGFGQASSISVLQLCQAYTAIFNDGKMMKPYVVESITDPATGEIIQEYQPEVSGTPISANTAAQVRDMMRKVLDPGMSGERFDIDGLDMIAKTGTGQLYNEETHTYDTKRYTSSIMAAVPGDTPKVMVYTGMVSENYLRYSADPFKNIMEAALVSASVEGSSASNNSYEEWETYAMPELVNHSISYIQKQLDGKKVNAVLIGNGDTIIDQFPKSGIPINSNDLIILKSNGSQIEMPDMSGWTRKDVLNYIQLSGISMDCSGYGNVTGQSIEPGTVIENGMEIVIYMSDTVENELDQAEPETDEDSEDMTEPESIEDQSEIIEEDDTSGNI